MKQKNKSRNEETSVAQPNIPSGIRGVQTAGSTQKPKNSTIESKIREWANICRKERIAICIYADGSWQQLGGDRLLYNIDGSGTKKDMAETIRILKMNMELMKREKRK